MLSISSPGAISATWDSVVLIFAYSWTCQVRPRSVEYMMPAAGVRSGSGSWCWNGTTRVPSSIVMPRPGPWKVKFQASCLTCRVRFTGADQVRPSSVERTIRSWGVVAGSKPLPAANHAALPASPPCVHAAKMSRSPVTSSTRMQGSPTPLTFCGRPPHSPMSMATIIGPQVRPPSVERLTPTSTCPCRSREFS